MIGRPAPSAAAVAMAAGVRAADAARAPKATPPCAAIPAVVARFPTLHLMQPRALANPARVAPREAAGHKVAVHKAAVRKAEVRKAEVREATDRRAAALAEITSGAFHGSCRSAVTRQRPSARVISLRTVSAHAASARPDVCAPCLTALPLHQSHHGFSKLLPASTCASLGLDWILVTSSRDRHTARVGGKYPWRLHHDRPLIQGYCRTAPLAPVPAQAQRHAGNRRTQAAIHALRMWFYSIGTAIGI